MVWPALQCVVGSACMFELVPSHLFLRSFVCYMCVVLCTTIFKILCESFSLHFSSFFVLISHGSSS
jgi:hypothetical protein